MCKTWSITLLAACFSIFAFAAGPAAAGRWLDIYGARQIAFQTGIQQIKKIELDDGEWEIKGWDAQGHKVEMEIRADSGEITKIERH
jgi:hypothetical protein